MAEGRVEEIRAEVIVYDPGNPEDKRKVRLLLRRHPDVVRAVAVVLVGDKQKLARIKQHYPGRVGLEYLARVVVLGEEAPRVARPSDGGHP